MDECHGTENAAVRRRCTRPASIIPRSDVTARAASHWRMRHPMVRGRYDGVASRARARVALKLPPFALAITFSQMHTRVRNILRTILIRSNQLFSA
jgi:hypothetical protein